MDKPASPLVAATVVETVLDIDCDFDSGLDMQSKVSAAKEAYRDHYPKVQVNHIRETTVRNLKEGESPEVEIKPGTVSRLLLRSEDEKTIVQVRANGFSFNEIKPSAANGQLLDLVKEDWCRYISLTSPTRINKISLRAICKIEVRLPGVGRAPDFSHILKYPPLAPDLDREIVMTGFISRLALAEPVNGDEISITMTNQEDNEGILPVILDVVVSHEGVEGVEWTGVSLLISRLNGLKHSVILGILDPSCSTKLLS